ncbi:hypothetical protein ABZX38_33140 [Streptomyces longwoodensis]|uniref:hypothetical protein n=1 Tax=Streptomyces longwoodensis TaxID=68231 RepID=UPI0033ACF5E6
MDMEAFWRVLDTAEDSDKPLYVVVLDHPSAPPIEEILAFGDRFSCPMRLSLGRMNGRLPHRRGLLR